MPSPLYKRWIILGAFLVLLGLLFIAIRNFWLSTFGFIVAVIGVALLAVAIPQAGRSGQGQA